MCVYVEEGGGEGGGELLKCMQEVMCSSSLLSTMPHSVTPSLHHSITCSKFVTTQQLSLIPDLSEK